MGTYFSVANPLAQRTTSSFALSIGTALAFESLFSGDRPVYDPTRPIPQRIKLNNYDEIWINLTTLLRNIFGSVGSAVQASLGAEDLFLTLDEEVQTIKALVRDNTQDRCKVVFYCTDSRRLKDKHPNARLRQDTTPKQISYAALRQIVLKEFLRRYSNLPGNKVFQEELIPGAMKSALIITHDSYDLLSWPRFEKLDLLESHTGLLKSRPMWYTKFQSSPKELMRIPFNSCFMQVFGDSVHFHPFAAADRQAIMKIADDRNWNFVTTKDRLKLSLELLENKVLAQMLKQMLDEK